MNTTINRSTEHAKTTLRVRCCICSHERTADGWAFVPFDPHVEYSHTYCPTCMGVETAKLDATPAPRSQRTEPQRTRPLWRRAIRPGFFVA